MRTKAAVWLTGVVAAVLATGPVGAAAETVVLPVVARGVPGYNGSVWDSEVRISGPRRFTGISVRRAWVALPDGGFVDDSATAPHWVFPTMVLPGIPYPQLFLFLTGDQLLQGTDASKGAVALEIEGNGNHVFLHNSNTRGQPRLPQDSEGPACCLPGNGQLIRGLTQPLVWVGFIPWITAGRSPYRVSVGVINPTAQARRITLEVDGADPYPSAPNESPDGTYWYAFPTTSVAIDLPPWGFRQVDDLASVLLQACPSCNKLDRVAPAAIFLSDYQNTNLPFYGYASVIWTPLNDPEFIEAVPFTP